MDLLIISHPFTHLPFSADGSYNFASDVQCLNVWSVPFYLVVIRICRDCATLLERSHKFIEGNVMAAERSKPTPRRHHVERKGFERAPMGDMWVGGRVWVEKQGKTYLAWGRVVLLERIEACGSISAAARSMGISYRHAWLLVDQINALAPFPLVVAQKGGRQGGGASLTPEGKKAIEGFWLLVGKFQSFLDEASHDSLLADLLFLKSPKAPQASHSSNV